jgi:hypothetical protein
VRVLLSRSIDRRGVRPAFAESRSGDLLEPDIRPATPQPVLYLPTFGSFGEHDVEILPLY